MTEWQKLKNKTIELFKNKLPILLEDSIKTTAMFVPKTKQIEYHDRIYVNDGVIDQLLKHWNSKKKDTHFAKLTKDGWSHKLNFIIKKPKIYAMFCEKSKK